MHKAGPPKKKLKQLSIKDIFLSKQKQQVPRQFGVSSTDFHDKYSSSKGSQQLYTCEAEVHDLASKAHAMESCSHAFNTPLKNNGSEIQDSSLLNALEECDKSVETSSDVVPTSPQEASPSGQMVNAEDVLLLESEDISTSLCNLTGRNACKPNKNTETVGKGLHQPMDQASPNRTEISSCSLQDDSPDLFEDDSPRGKTHGIVQPVTEDQLPAAIGTPYDHLRTLFNCELCIDEQSATHSILFEGAYDNVTPPAPISQSYTDRWDSHHVRLPCSPENLYPVQTPNGKKLCARWEMIQSSLLLNITSSIDLEEAILTYNSRFAHQWSFQALHRFFTETVDTTYAQHFFAATLPSMVHLALSLPSLFPEPIPLLCQHRCQKVTMSQQQIACLLCNAFFCTFPRRNTRHRDSEYANYPEINFNRMFQVNNGRRDKATCEKIRTLLHYFQRVTEKMPTGAVTFERRSLHDFPVWSKSPCTLCKLRVTRKGKIEDARGMLQVDFANRYVGGGVLRTGLVQEEIRFCICPELVAAMLFMERMDDNECIVITGAEQYSLYTGYAETYEWAGNYVDQTPRDDLGRTKCQIVAMDATRFDRPVEQYAPARVERELNKAYCGFYCKDGPDNAPAIATGNWGCGAFKGDPIFKGLLQLMAAAAVGRDLCYFTFDDSILMQELHEMHTFITENNIPICDLWRVILLYNSEVHQKSGKTKESFARFLIRTRSYEESTDEEL